MAEQNYSYETNGYAEDVLRGSEMRKGGGKTPKNVTMADLFRNLIRNIKWVLLLTLAGLLVSSAVVGVRYIKEKDITRYKTDALIAVITTNDASSATTQWQFSTKLVASAEKCLYTNSAAQGITEATGVRITKEKLISSLSFDGDDDEKTQFITLTLVWDGTPEETKEILESAIAQLKPQFEKIGYGDTATIDPPGDPVRVPIRPAYLYVVIGTAAGLLLGCALAVILGLFRGTVTNKDELAEELGMDTIGEIPYSRLPSDSRYLLVTDPEAGFAYTEAYRIYGSILRHTLQRDGIKAFCVTSAMANEGKTTVTINSALLLAEREHFRVLLIDFDTRKPKVRRALGIESDVKTLGGALEGKYTVKEAIRKYSEHLDVICCLPLIDFTMTDSLVQQLLALREDYDYVIYDTPPVGIVSDALLLNEVTDASVFVVRHDYVTTDILKKAADTLSQANRPVIGAVLNEVREGRLKEAYRAGKYKEYGYYSYEASANRSKAKKAKKQ